MSTSGCVLLNVHACWSSIRYVDHTTASHTTSNDHIIEVSLRPSRPPCPSDLLVHCPGLHSAAFAVVPRIVRAVGELLLLRVTIRYGGDYVWPEDCDYFIYRADANGRPSLQLLPRPDPFFHDDEVGLLGRGEHYTVAVLSATPTGDLYDLHLLHSETPDTWNCSKVLVVERQRGFPVEIPRNCHRLLYHDTNTVITIGGEGGTMGWVDLWRGILLCDVLCEQPTLRGVPLPLPVNLMKGNNGNGFELGCPKSLRGISVIKDKKSGVQCLRFVHLEPDATQLPGEDEETGSLSFVMSDWAIATWSNYKMTSSWKDWDEGPRVLASTIITDSHLNSELLRSGLLLEKTQDDCDGAERALQNLMVTDPAPGIDEEYVVYLMSRVKFLHPKAWVLEIDTSNNTLRSAAEFDTERQPGARVVCCPSSISMYLMNPESTSPGGN